MRSRGWKIGVVALLAIGSLGLVKVGAGADEESARAVLRNAAGAKIGVVKFIQHKDGVLVKADGLEFPSSQLPGFKGFHIHANGVCDPTAVDPATSAVVPFFSAGGHYNPATVTHGNHGGDMPVLQVNADGSASARFLTDHFDVSDIKGRAVIVHKLADNFGAIPTAANPQGTANADQQYTPNTAAATTATNNTGNAGPRYACGVIEESDSDD